MSSSSSGKIWPLTEDCIRFVDSVHSDQFLLLLSALDRAYLVAMDAEWKPLRSRKAGSSFPRVAIMQIACRLRTEQQMSPRYAVAESCSHAGSDIVCYGADKLIEKSFQNLKEETEMIFVLDMLSLPAWSFWEAMKRMLVSPTVLKLGFKFKQDLVNLAQSFSGPDAHSCFDKAVPCVDVGRLYNQLRGYNTSSIAYEQAMASEALSLTTVCEQVTGYTLSKDLQCSDWEQRPLTLEQRLYAAADAHCLLVIYDVLETEACSWEFKGYEDISASSLKVGLQGIAESLLSDSLGGTIIHAPCEIALKMVQPAGSDGSMEDLYDFAAPHMLVARKFGERLLAIKGSSLKKKPKIRRARENVAAKKDCQEIPSWSGPPPWDPSCGGDGSPKFLCDIMVEGLARQLRNVGIDTLCPHVKKSDPRRLVELAEKEGRVLLTQDTKLLRRRLFPPNCAYGVQSLGKQNQLAEVVRTFSLVISEEDLLSRCTKCNGNFIPGPLSPEAALTASTSYQTIPDYAITERLLFWQCADCGHMYWQGNQFHRALKSFQAFARRIQVNASQ